MKTIKLEQDMGTFIAVIVILFTIGFVGGLISELLKRAEDLPGTKIFAKCVICGVLLVAVFSWGAPWWCLVPAGIIALC